MHKSGSITFHQSPIPLCQETNLLMQNIFKETEHLVSKTSLLQKATLSTVARSLYYYLYYQINNRRNKFTIEQLSRELAQPSKEIENALYQLENDNLITIDFNYLLTINLHPLVSEKQSYFPSFSV